MKLIKKLLDKLLNSIVSPDYVGDMAKHRQHTTKYEDLCK